MRTNISLIFFALFSIVFDSVLAKVNVALKDNLPGTDIQTPSELTLIRSGPKGSKLYQFNSPNSVYQDAPYLLDLGAGLTSYEQGYENGYLLANEYLENYDNLLKALLGDAWWEPLVQSLLGKFLEYEWVNYMSKQLPQEYLDEISGISAGGKAIGAKRDVGKVAGWGITLANFPGDLDDLVYILTDEKNHPPPSGNEGALTEAEMKLLFSHLSKNWKGFTCSMFGVWGSRTADGRLYTGRNLDWLKDSGISTYKLVTIHRPPNGFAHATIGWAGIWGAITGMSSQGLTVHEANLESNDITFRGFPWVLRLRHVMAYASTLDEALAIWQSTNNTVGFNHGVGSAKDGQAVLLETMMGNTAVFYANDPREQDLVINGEQIGLAREEAIYRTNHGYDSYTIEHYMWNGTKWYNNSIIRYQVFAELFDGYQAAKTPITHVEAVSIV
jgi:hypothetical protein